MCIVVGEDRAYVSNTRIYARGLADGRQVLVYAMGIEARSDQAMILPIPVPMDAKEDAVRFIDLGHSPGFFSSLDDSFDGTPRSNETDLAGELEEPDIEDLLTVHQVGDFIASFVPTARDWGRVDPRFRLPEETWGQMPQYDDWGFAVFQLDLRPQKPPEEELAELHEFYVSQGFDPAQVEEHDAASTRYHKIHPMAFEFPRRDAQALFFPTVHVHNGHFDPIARFDHTLYYQGNAEQGPIPWECTDRLARSLHYSSEIDLPRLTDSGVLDLQADLHRHQVRGSLQNRDIVLR